MFRSTPCYYLSAKPGDPLQTPSKLEDPGAALQLLLKFADPVDALKTLS